MADKYVNSTGLSRFLTKLKAWVNAQISAYTPPVATTTAAGTVKVGNGLAVTSDGTLSVNIQSASNWRF